MISFIIPAHNEEGLLPQTLRKLRASASSLSEPFEIVVAADACTDRTAEVAASLGASVVAIDCRHIAAARNAGARASHGDVLVFIDADTLVPAATLQGVYDALRKGAICGGAFVQLEENAPRWAHIVVRLIVTLWFRLRLAGGCFAFARREAYEAVGGWDERYFAGEELFFSLALKRLGPFAMIRHPVITSARKFRTHGGRHMATYLLRLLLKGPRVMRSRDGLSFWYDGKREAPRPQSSAPRDG